MEKTRRVKREGRVVRAVARAYVLLTQKTIKPYESGIITFYQVIQYRARAHNACNRSCFAWPWEFGNLHGYSF